MALPFFLLADDDEDDRYLFSQALLSIDPAIEFMMVGNGGEVITILANDFFSLPDYIFLDLNMPVMNGLDCLKAIKKDPACRNCRVVLYSTTMEEQSEKEFIQAGALACFTKPAAPAELAVILRTLCGL